MKNWIYYLVGIIVVIVLTKQCDGETITKIETVTEYVKVTDTITNTIIQEVPKLVYIEKVKTLKGKDSIIYKNKPSETTINANQYEARVESNNATADLKITTTGELLDVTGIINFTQENTTTTITNTKNKSGAFLYLETGFSKKPERFELGIDYQIKNKYLIDISVDYNTITQSSTVNGKIGLKLF